MNDTIIDGVTTKVIFNSCRIIITNDLPKDQLIIIHDNVPASKLDLPRSYEVELYNCIVVDRLNNRHTLIENKFPGIKDQTKLVKVKGSILNIANVENFLFVLDNPSNTVIINDTEYVGFYEFALPQYTYFVENDMYEDVPSLGYFKVGERLYHRRPLSGSFIGWVCVSSGIANRITWKSNTIYFKGDLVNYNSKVYKCMEPGKSGTVAPSHISGIELDGTVKWEYISNKAQFKKFGYIE